MNDDNTRSVSEKPKKRSLGKTALILEGTVVITGVLLFSTDVIVLRFM